MADIIPFPKRQLPPHPEQSTPASRSEPEPLWRSVLGARLRGLRRDKGYSLTRTADRAGISPQYLSEIERGRKEPSSEIVAAVAGALDCSVLEVASQTVADLRLRRQQGRPSGPVLMAA